MNVEPCLQRSFCSICCTVIRKVNSKQHVESHLSDKCPKCDFMSDTQEIMHKHIAGHLHDWFECLLCGEIFAGSAAYKEHANQHKPMFFVQSVVYECSLCSANFSSGLNTDVRIQLEAHEERHLAVKDIIVIKPELDVKDEIMEATKDGEELTTLAVDCDISENEDAQNDGNNGSGTGQDKNLEEVRKKPKHTNRKCSKKTKRKGCNEEDDYDLSSKLRKSSSPSKVKLKKKKDKVSLMELPIKKKKEPEYPFSCPICNRKYQSKSGLNRHKKTDHSGQPKTKVGRPKKTEVDDDPIVACKSCDLEFHSFSALRDHNKATHLQDEDSEDFSLRLVASAWVCRDCGKRCKNQKSYRAHTLQHESPLECPTCHSSFLNLRRLQHHMNIKKCHVCDICGARSRCPAELKKHKMCHTGERPFQCNECGDTFRTKTYFDDHMRAHRGEKRHQCKFCSMKFVRQSNWWHHMRTHTGERPHLCNICGKSFGIRAKLNEHLRIHNEEKYDCPLCDRKITTKSNLDKHLKVHAKRGEVLPVNVQYTTEDGFPSDWDNNNKDHIANSHNKKDHIATSTSCIADNLLQVQNTRAAILHDSLPLQNTPGTSGVRVVTKIERKDISEVKDAVVASNNALWQLQFNPATCDDQNNVVNTAVIHSAEVDNNNVAVDSDLLVGYAI